jgi:hypothetical protein
MAERLGAQLQSGGLEQSIHTGLLSTGLFGGASLDLNFAVTKNVGPLVTFTRASSATYIDSAGTLRTAVTNLQRWSEDFTQGLTPNNATLTANQGIAPNGTLTANQFLETTANGLHSQEIVDHVFIAGVTYTFSCYAKTIGARNFGPGFPTLFGSARFGWFDLTGSGSVVSTNAGVTASIQAVGDGWYRCSITSTCVTGGGARVGVFIASGTSIFYAGDITKGLLLWGAQLEQSSTVGEYIPTTSTINSAPRFDHNPTTGESLGLLVEEQRTNSIRNNTMVGAVAGTPGTLPTNWSTFTSLTGLTRQIVGTGTENGISYLDVKLSGTPSAAGSYFLQFETSTGVAASNGQTWTSSGYFKLAGGSLTGITTRNIAASLRDSGGGELGRVVTAFTPTSSDIITQRVQATVTNNNASTAAQLNYIELVLSGAAIDITLRIGLPQLEQGAFATSVILTDNTAPLGKTRNADVANITGTNFSSWYRQDEGTVFVDALRSYSGNFPAFPNIVQFNDGTVNNLFAIYGISGGQAVTNFTIQSGGVAQTDFVQVATNVPGPNRIAQALAVNSSMLAANGALTLQDSSVAMPVGINRVTIGADRLSLSQWGGHIRRLVYWGQRLPNNVLQAITQ